MGRKESVKYKSRKFADSEVDVIVRDRKKGASIYSLAKKWDCCWETISCIVNDDFRKKKNFRAKIWYCQH